MYHKYRWTPEKIQKRLQLIAPLVYIKRSALPSFRYLELTGPEISPPVAADVDDGIEVVGLGSVDFALGGGECDLGHGTIIVYTDPGRPLWA